MKKKILIISYYIGSNKTVGGKRWLNYSNILAKLNYDVYVLSTKGNIDYENLNNKIKVFSIDSNYPSVLDKIQFDFLDKIQYKLSKLYLQLLCKGSIYDRSKRLEHILKKTVNKIISENNINNIIVSGAPFSLLYYVTKNFKNNTNIISDFRDPWTKGIGYGMKSLSRKRMNFEKFCKNFVLKHSNKIICASKDLSMMFDDQLSQYNKKSIVLLNADFITQKKSCENNKNQSSKNDFKLIHIGTIPLGTEIYWLRFLDLLQFSDYNIKLDVFSNNNISFFEEVCRRSDLQIEFHERLDSVQLKNKFDIYDACVLFKMDGFPNTFPTKFFDYISSNKPIISFTKNGIFSDELEHNNIGAAFNQNTTLTDFNSFLSSCQSLNYDNYDFSKFEISSEVNKLTAIIE